MGSSVFDLDAALAAQQPTGSVFDLDAALAAQRAPQRSNLDILGSSFTGLGKSAYNTFAGATQLFAPIMERLGLGGQFPPLRSAPIEPEEETAAKLGNIAQFLLPGGPIKGAAGAVAQGAKAGGLSLAQGETGANAILSTILGGAGPAVASVLPKAAPGMRETAKKRMSQFLQATKDFRKTEAEKIIPRMLDEGISGTRSGVLTRATKEHGRLQAEQAAVKQAQGQTPVDTDLVADSMNRLRRAFMRKDRTGNLVPATKDAEGKLALIDDLQVRIRDTEPTLESLAELRTILGGEISTKGFNLLPSQEKAAIRIKEAAYNAIRRELHRKSPDLEVLDRDLTFWRRVEEILTETKTRTLPQEGGLFKGLATRAAGGVGLYGAATGSMETVGIAIAGDAMSRLISSPLWKSWTAVRKNQLARSLANGRYDQALAMIGRGLAATRTTTQSTGRP